MKDIDQFINSLFEELNEKQIKVVADRFGLKAGEGVTLQEIGDDLGITRERVRQIEEWSLNKLRNKAKEGASDFLDLGIKHLSDLSGARRDDHFISDIKNIAGFNPKIKNLDQKIRFVFWITETPFYQKEDDEMHSFWYVDENAKEGLFNFVKKMLRFFESNDKNVIINDKIYLNHCKDFNQCNHLSISKYFGVNNFGDFGLKKWPEIEPKTIRDKIYLVLKKHGKPLHFETIADFITKWGISKKRAHIQTTHNELINDDRFVLVGRGIYGLKELGFEPGTVREVITSVLKKKGPLTPVGVVDAVNEKRYFKKNTILLNLQNRQYFKRLEDGRYHLKRG